ncbi:MAG TPA: molybdopterin cofactor-binding domain-containing protein [Chthoniobacterales bacterium]
MSYAPEVAILTMAAAKEDAKKPKKNQDENVQPKKGDVDAALKNNDLIKIEQTYITPTETHNPIEMHGTIAAWRTIES